MVYAIYIDATSAAYFPMRSCREHGESRRLGDVPNVTAEESVATKSTAESHDEIKRKQSDGELMSDMCKSENRCVILRIIGST